MNIFTVGKLLANFLFIRIPMTLYSKNRGQNMYVCVCLCGNATTIFLVYIFFCAVPVLSIFILFLCVLFLFSSYPPYSMCKYTHIHTIIIRACRLYSCCISTDQILLLCVHMMQPAANVSAQWCFVCQSRFFLLYFFSFLLLYFFLHFSFLLNAMLPV